MSFLLDTDTCSAHLKRPSGLAHRFIQHTGRLALSTVVLAELHDWAHLRPDPGPRLRQIKARASLATALVDARLKGGGVCR